MTCYERAGKNAVASRLAGCREPVSLWSVSCTADDGARQAGRKRELFKSLYEYADVLPPGWKTQWLSARGGTSDRMLMATPPGWVPGEAPSRELLLGSGPLVPA